MTRDPREEPRPGDRLSLHGAVFQVLEVASDKVRLTAERDELSGLGAGHWYGLHRFQRRFHDAEPENDSEREPCFTPRTGPDSSHDVIMEKYYLETEGCE